jgi:hypothetical protein
MITLNRSLDYMFLRGVCTSKQPTRPEASKVPSWASDWQSLWSGDCPPYIEGRLLGGFRVVSHNNNPVLAGSTTSLLRVQGASYGRVESLTSALLPHSEYEKAGLSGSLLDDYSDTTLLGIFNIPNTSADDKILLKQIYEGLLGSRMRLAILRQISRNDDRLTVAMVHPQTEISDEVYFLSACSVAVTLRRKGIDPNLKTYSVIGVAYARGQVAMTGQETRELV